MKKRENIMGIEVLTAAALGAGGSILVSLALSALSAKLVSQEITSISSIDMMVVGTLVLSAMIGAILACAMCARPRLPVCLATGMVFYLVLFACNALMFDGMCDNFWGTAIAILGGCGAVALMGLKGERRGVYKQRVKKRDWKVVQN